MKCDLNLLKRTSIAALLLAAQAATAASGPTPDWCNKYQDPRLCSDERLESNEQQVPIKVLLKAEIQELNLPVSVEVSGQKSFFLYSNGRVLGEIRDVVVSIIPQSEIKPLPQQGQFFFKTNCISSDAIGTVRKFSSSGYNGNLSPDRDGNLSGKLRSALSPQLSSFAIYPLPKVVGQTGPDFVCQQELEIKLDGVPLKNRTDRNSSSSGSEIFVLSL